MSCYYKPLDWPILAQNNNSSVVKNIASYWQEEYEESQIV
jgi:hypothetical protein